MQHCLPAVPTPVMIGILVVLMLVSGACRGESDGTGGGGAYAPVAGYGGQPYAGSYVYGGAGGGAGLPQPAAGVPGISGAGGGGEAGAAGAFAVDAGAVDTGGLGGEAGAGGAVIGGAGGMDTGGTAAAGTGGAGGASGASSAAGGAGAGAGAGSTLPPITDYTQAGPFATTTTESNVGPGAGYTIFRPDPLGANGFLHSPVVFGPGIMTSPSMYNTLLTHLATHGFVTICVNALTGNPANTGNDEAMRTGLDWLIAQNSEPGIYRGVLAVDRAVTMGYSLGATASVRLSSYPPIATTVAIHGHDTSGDPLGPVLLLTGTQDVINDVRSTLSTLDEAPAMLAALPIGHLNVLSELSATGRYIAPITAWLRYWVNGDDDAKRFFWGADCEMCSSPWITPETNAPWDAQSL